MKEGKPCQNRPKSYIPDNTGCIRSDGEIVLNRKQDEAKGEEIDLNQEEEDILDSVWETLRKEEKEKPD